MDRTRPDYSKPLFITYFAFFSLLLLLLFYQKLNYRRWSTGGGPRVPPTIHYVIKYSTFSHSSSLALLAVLISNYALHERTSTHTHTHTYVVIILHTMVHHHCRVFECHFYATPRATFHRTEPFFAMTVITYIRKSFVYLSYGFCTYTQTVWFSVLLFERLNMINAWR